MRGVVLGGVDFDDLQLLRPSAHPAGNRGGDVRKRRLLAVEWFDERCNRLEQDLRRRQRDTLLFSNRVRV